WYPAASISAASFLSTSSRAYTRSTWRCSAAISSAAYEVMASLGGAQGLGGAVPEHERGHDAGDDRDEERHPREVGQPALGGAADGVDEVRRTGGPHDPAAGVGGEEPRVRHREDPGARTGEAPQQRAEPAEDHRPPAPWGEDPFTLGDGGRAEVSRDPST